MAQELCRLINRIEELENELKECKTKLKERKKSENLQYFNENKDTLKLKKVMKYAFIPAVLLFTIYAHIGNLRTYVFMDLLRKVLKYNGYKLNHVMNITDVGHLVSDSDEGEDKMVKTAKATKKSPYEIAEYYTNVFFKDIAKLNIEKPEIIPKATDNIKERLSSLKNYAKGYAYETSDGIYFDIMKFRIRLARLDIEGRLLEWVKQHREKHPADFALWKKAQEL